MPQLLRRAGAFCFMHDPARREAAQAARARGGHATRRPRFADVLRECMEAEIDKIIAAHVDALASDDARVRLHAAEALLAAAPGPRELRALPPVFQRRAWTVEDVMLDEPLAIGLDTRRPGPCPRAAAGGGIITARAGKLARAIGPPRQPCT